MTQHITGYKWNYKSVLQWSDGFQYSFIFSICNIYPKLFNIILAIYYRFLPSEIIFIATWKLSLICSMIHIISLLNLAVNTSLTNEKHANEQHYQTGIIHFY